MYIYAVLFTILPSYKDLYPQNSVAVLKCKKSYVNFFLFRYFKYDNFRHVAVK